MPDEAVGRDADIVVAGGGFAGFATGSTLAAAGFSVVVVDAGPAASFRGELIHPGGVRALTNLGLRPALMAADAVQVPGFAAYSDPRREPVLIPYPEEVGLGLAVDHADLVRTLRDDFVARPRAKLIAGRVDELVVRDGRATGVLLADGTEIRAQLVIAADGRHSRLRLRLGLPTDVLLHSYTLAPVIEGNLLPFPGYGHVFVGGPGPILAYPYGHNRVRMCIDVPMGIKGGRRGLVAYVREHHTAYVPEPLRSAMLQSLEQGSFAGSANHAVATDRCVAPGVALVGDACGCSHPVTATGLTTALNDVTVLAECLTTRGLVNEALLEYQRRRYRYSRAREVFAQAMFEVLRGSDDGSRGLRDGMFQYWRSSERARLASMAILCGDDSRPAAFASEYSRVMVRSVYEAARQRPMRRLARDVAAMLTTAGGCLDIALERVLATAALEVARDRAVPVLPATTSVPEGANLDGETAKRTTLRRVRRWLSPAA